MGHYVRAISREELPHIETRLSEQMDAKKRGNKRKNEEEEKESKMQPIGAVATVNAVFMYIESCVYMNQTYIPMYIYNCMKRKRNKRRKPCTKRRRKNSLVARLVYHTIVWV